MRDIIGRDSAALLRKLVSWLQNATRNIRRLRRGTTCFSRRLAKLARCSDARPPEYETGAMPAQLYFLAGVRVVAPLWRCARRLPH